MDIGDERCGGYCKGDNLMKNINKRDSAIYSCFFVLAGALLLIHYICIRPIMICDPDDWTYISYIRQAVPLWGAWNPAKIFRRQ